jgi:hypothetical protein
MEDAERDARRLMHALVGKGYPMGDAIPNAQLRTVAVEVDIDGQEQTAAIEYAGDRGWIGNGARSGSINLTQAGWDCGNA